MVGGFGDDTLVGGAGADVMTGGAGSDLYYVDSADDVVIEDGDDGGAIPASIAAAMRMTFAPGVGQHPERFGDTVIASVDYILSDNIEALRLVDLAILGTGNAQGNAQGNDIVGNAQDNTLSGLDGNDRLDGDSGDDGLLPSRAIRSDVGAGKPTSTSLSSTLGFLPQQSDVTLWRHAKKSAIFTAEL